MKIFTDEDGNEYERVDTTKHGVLIKPIKKVEEKRGLTIVVWYEISGGSVDSDCIYNQREIYVTEAQATAIADFIKAGMTYITGSEGNIDYQCAVKKAAELIQRDKNDQD